MAFGMLWLLITPLLLLAVYSVVYIFVFRVRPVAMTEFEYVAYLFCGLVPFLAMSEGLVAGMQSLSAHSVLLTSTVFPVEILAVRSVVASQTGFAAGMAVLICVALWLGQPGMLWVLLMPLIVLQLLFLIGIGWVLSMAVLIFRDLQNIVSILILVLMVLSPIAYTPDMVPPALRMLIWLNPFAYFVIAYQSILITGQALSPWIAGVLLALGLGAFLGGFALFSKWKTVVADYA